jgi:dephospho-CoA kinase
VRTIGLTGGIGTGKTTVAKMLRQMGVTLIDADQAVREVEARGTPAWRRLVEDFGPAILAPDGELDRKRLADIAFSDVEARRRLESIVHPLARRWMAERHQEAALRGEKVVVHDIPLLFETGHDRDFDAVLLVYAPAATQLQRLTEFRSMPEAEARARIAAQMPIDDKRALTQHVIENTGDLEDLRRAVERAWAQAVPDL